VCDEPETIRAWKHEFLMAVLLVSAQKQGSHQKICSISAPLVTRASFLVPEIR